MRGGLISKFFEDSDKKTITRYIKFSRHRGPKDNKRKSSRDSLG